jgi:exonuclease III
MSLNKGFKMALLNINSLSKHIDELVVLMHGKPLDILAINESKLDQTDTTQQN